jgi:hypothetical protein
MLRTRFDLPPFGAVFFALPAGRKDLVCCAGGHYGGELDALVQVRIFRVALYL